MFRGVIIQFVVCSIRLASFVYRAWIPLHKRAYLARVARWECKAVVTPQGRVGFEVREGGGF